MAAKKKSAKQPAGKSETALVPLERIQDAILTLRGQRVMLDFVLAELYGVENRALLQAVKRNLDRFPEDFTFQLSSEEFENLRSQTVISSWGGRRYPPYAFTEQGVAMLSSVLRSKRAAQVNVEIMRAFVRLRQTLAASQVLARRITELEKRTDTRFVAVFKAIRLLAEGGQQTRRLIQGEHDKAKSKPPIGFPTKPK